MSEVAPKKKSFRDELADRYPTRKRKQAGKDGVVTIRMPSELHDRLYDTAVRESMSMNRICTVAIERALDDIDSDPSEFDPERLSTSKSNQHKGTDAESSSDEP